MSASSSRRAISRSRSPSTLARRSTRNRRWKKPSLSKSCPASNRREAEFPQPRPPRVVTAPIPPPYTFGGRPSSRLDCARRGRLDKRPLLFFSSSLPGLTCIPCKTHARCSNQSAECRKSPFTTHFPPVTTFRLRRRDRRSRIHPGFEQSAHRFREGELTRLRFCQHFMYFFGVKQPSLPAGCSPP